MKTESYSIESLENSNKLFAEFMGLKVISKKDFEHNAESFNVNEYNISEYQRYNKEWNWLMPVVEKIETMSLLLPEKYKTGFYKRENATTAEIGINILYDAREEFKGWSADVRFVLGGLIWDGNEKYTSKIDATYKAVIAFIEWYNTLYCL